MSVLKAHRSESKAEFINTANKIYVQTINFLSRLSSRYSRLVADSVSGLAAEVLDNAEKRTVFFPRMKPERNFASNTYLNPEPPLWRSTYTSPTVTS